MLKIPRALGTLACVGALLLASACGTGASGSGGGQPGQLSVVTSFYPLQFLAERIAGSHAHVENLTPAGTEPHDLELTPQQVGAISQADLVVYERTFQAAVDQAIDNTGGDTAFDITSVTPLEPITSAGHDHDEHEGADPDESDHGHGENDPHVWLDPTKMVTITEALTERFTELDPDHAADYDRNAAALRDDLTTLDTEFTDGLASCERTEFITSHAAFGYLAKRYHLTQIGISGLSPDAEPSPARIAEVHREAEEHGITTIFYETLVSPDVAKSIAGDLGLRTDVLDPLEGITDQSHGEDYLAVMRSNLAALQTANGCQ